MAQEKTAWPRRTRELQHPLLDATVWDAFRFRPDDVVIATYAKTGTTWMQQIVGQLIFGGREDVDVWAVSPWLDRRATSREAMLATFEAQTHRRFIKTHLPAHALRSSPEARYIYIARRPRRRDEPL